MTYFRRRGPTIIGADMFHGPVRKGKGWFHVAMVARRNGLYGAAVATTLMFGLNSGSGNRKKKFRMLSIQPGQIALAFKVIGSSLTGN